MVLTDEATQRLPLAALLVNPCTACGGEGGGVGAIEPRNGVQEDRLELDK